MGLLTSRKGRGANPIAAKSAVSGIVLISGPGAAIAILIEILATKRAGTPFEGCAGALSSTWNQ